MVVVVPVEALVVDFEDSFTYNIVEFFYGYKIPYKMINWKGYRHPREKLSSTIIVLGPGPGVVEDYRSLLPEIKINSSDSNIFYFGICLGHQILGVKYGFKLYQEQPVHGQSVQVKIPPWSCFPVAYRGEFVSVQRYNSWTLKYTRDHPTSNLSRDGMFLWTPHSLSFQFHPESVGTSCPSLFFEAMLKLAYNRKHHG